MIFTSPPPVGDTLREALRRASTADETSAVEALITEAEMSADAEARVRADARRLIVKMRAGKLRGLDAFLQEYSLSSQEGVILMCLAEALLRVPDRETRDRLIRDKLGSCDWNSHLGHSLSLLVNASTFALMLTGRVILPDRETERELSGFWRRLIGRSGEPVVRQAVVQAMLILSGQFIMGATIGEATERAAEEEARGYRHSFDMLGEAARTAAAAESYLEKYSTAITYIGLASAGRGPIAGPGISVKLSALHPRYEYAQAGRVMAELVPRLTRLAEEAASRDISLCVDAEEADRLDLSLDVISAVLDRLPRGWEGFGLAVQAYQKRAPLVVDWIAEAARSRRRRMQMRLVKGAYWDGEIKRAQERGLPGYPVFTRKLATDVSYLACAKRMAAADVLYSQFATHNAHTLVAVKEILGGRRDYEFQRLHGMGESLHDQILGEGLACRVYCPVGSHEDLLPYLLRRLLENGANTSFVNRLSDAAAPIDALVADPAAALRAATPKPHHQIPLPVDLYRPERKNSIGLDLADPFTLAPLANAMTEASARRIDAVPVIGGDAETGETKPVFDPADLRRQVGTVVSARPKQVDRAVAAAHSAARDWDATSADDRATILERAADIFETNRAELMTLLVREAGKTIPDALAEVREAIDFLRYYAARGRADFSAEGLALPGPTGESNCLALHGRGVFACISPWNFPLAIFTGQVAAALAAGNSVVAKPAEQTPLVAYRAVKGLQEAGLPGAVLSLVPGDGQIGAQLVADPRVAGVAFTGSTEVAKAIQRSLAERNGPIVPLMAETGGLNSMIVDSSALPEQVVQDVIVSAFQSAGQRCSALRVLFLQDEVANRVLGMLAGAMVELSIGDPGLLSTDIGPLIDRAAQARLNEHAKRMDRTGRTLHVGALPAGVEGGCFFAPRLVEIDGLGRLDGEVFGPFLHVVRYSAAALDRVLDAVAATGFGLTLGIHSRIDTTVRRIVERARVGNIYVNRSMIGAVVGTQPFGGEGLSGTGPKAGGPRTLHRFATERSVTVNLSAAGGNASLLSLDPKV
jgi:RHH-type proline utilization regulon transcriptional repressor/proline dehydrogenase/delta 1-pyrroline-5-carboxylate dehydrogenase